MTNYDDFAKRALSRLYGVPDLIIEAQRAQFADLHGLSYHPAGRDHSGSYNHEAYVVCWGVIPEGTHRLFSDCTIIHVRYYSQEPGKPRQFDDEDDQDRSYPRPGYKPRGMAQHEQDANTDD